MVTVQLQSRLENDQNLWVSTVRKDGRPHLTPVWFVWFTGKFYICIDANSIKARNLSSNPYVVVALEEGTHPLICEGEAFLLDKPYPDDIQAAFYDKYEWEIANDPQYNLLIEIKPKKWLSW
jgi:general stress protein 26